MSTPQMINRAFVPVQQIIREFLDGGVTPTSKQIQKKYYGSECNYDSRIQVGTIYGCIMRGRENVVNSWDYFVNEERDENGARAFESTKAQLIHYQPELVEEEINSSLFREFCSEVYSGRFPRTVIGAMRIIKQHPVVGIMFKNKLKELASLGSNYIIPTRGKNSVWFEPVWWQVQIYECKLYTGSLKRLVTQLERGSGMGVMLPSGKPIKGVLENLKRTKDAIEDHSNREQ